MKRRPVLVPLVSAILSLGMLAPATAAPTAPPPTAPPPTQAPPVPTALPEPTGPMPVGTSVDHLVDADRADPWAPDARRRELMIQTWYPARPAHRPQRTAEYQSRAAAQALETILGARSGSFSAVVTNARHGTAALPGRRRWPVLLLSPGRGGNRTNLTIIAEDLASHGYVVVGVDHTYDALAVEFPGGRIVTANRPAVPDDRAVVEEVGVRAADLRFVLDEVLAGRAARPVRGRLDHRRVGVLGHSLGGATAAELLRTDRRVRAGVNLDGAFFTTGSTLAVGRPFLLFSRPAEHHSWTRWHTEQRAWGRHLVVTGAGHFSFTDFSVLAGPAGIEQPMYGQLFGTITAHRIVALDRDHLRAFFALHLHGRRTSVFDRPAQPEITIVDAPRAGH